MVTKQLIDSKKAFIFDLDGTIVDSMWVWKSIDIEFLGSIGYELPNDLQKCIEGMSFYETAEYFKKRFNIEKTPEEIIEIWNEMAFDKYSNEVTLKPGIIEFLNYLKNNNKLIGIATSNSRTLAYEALKRKGIYDFFDVILTGDECGKGKPEPDVFINTASALKASPSDCIVFEDLPAGIIAGSRAGMDTVAISDDYSAYQWDKKVELADYCIQDYKEIVNELLHT